jgi:hypothetical protein
MARMRAAHRSAQAWIELRADDPEALSALAVARARLAAGAALEGVRRLRLFELAGPLPARALLGDLFHRSTQFYNPAKERCTVRVKPQQPAPLGPGEAAVLVFERGGERRAAAERWWEHESGRAVEVREGVVWALRFAAGADPEREALALAVLRDRQHGLLCNPHSQESRVALGEPPLAWMTSEHAPEDPGRAGGEA